MNSEGSKNEYKERSKRRDMTRENNGKDDRVKLKKKINEDINNNKIVITSNMSNKN